MSVRELEFYRVGCKVTFLKVYFMVKFIPAHLSERARQLSERVDSLDDNIQSGRIGDISIMQNLAEELFTSWTALRDEINNVS